MKYRQELVKADKDYDTYRLIPIYVKLGEMDNAWSLAMKIKDTDELVFHILRESFQSAGLGDEVEKVTKLINSSESDS